MTPRASEAPAVLLTRVHALLSADRAGEALATCDELLAIAPRHPGVRGLRASALLTLQRAPEALEEATQALRLDATDTQAWVTFGYAAIHSGFAPRALAAFDQAVAMKPLLARAHAGRGLALAALSRTHEAVAAYAQAARLDPRDGGTFQEVGHLMLRLGRLDNAHASFSAALDLQPGALQSLEGQTMTLLALNRHTEALPGLDRLRDAGASIDYLLGQRLHAHLHCCDWSEYPDAIEKIVAGVKLGQRIDLPLGFIVHSASPDDQRRCAEIYVADRGGVDVAPLPHRSRSPSRRLRVGYLSADFRDHPVAQLCAGVFEAHDGGRVETFGFSAGLDDGSALRRRIGAGLDHFIDVSALQDRALAEAIAERDIDIVVDLGGHTTGSRTRALAFKPAPIQVAFLGFPGTTGAPYIDYVIADRQVIPEDERQHYTEQVVYLPACYLPNDALGPASDTIGPVADASRRERAGLPGTGFVYCSFNAAYKILPPMFDAWMRILRAVPFSVLWLRGGSATASRHLAREAERRGVDPARLIGAPKMPTLAQHHARLSLADLFLDTHPYGAHTTASDGLRCGVPVLTLRGRTFASRVAGSLLHACGMGDLAVDTLESYEQRAIEIGTHAGLATSLKARLQDNLRTTPLFDPLGFCRHLEAAYAGMMERATRAGRADMPSTPAT